MMNIMPGEHDWMKVLQRNPFSRNPLGGFGGMGGIFADPRISGGVMGDDEMAAARDAKMAMAAQLLAGSGWSPQRRSFGELVGQAMLAGQNARAQSMDRSQERKLREVQIKKIENDNDDPASVREYQYAVQNGFKGSFQDWITAGGQSSRPSAVQEWEFYDKLTPDQKKLYLEMKRNPNMSVQMVGQVPTVVAPSVSGTATTPLSTLPAEAAAAGTIKGAEAEASAEGKARGELTGGILTKGSNAVSTQGTIDIAEPLIDVATGSATGATRDKVAAWFGKATTGAEAIAELKVLQSSLMMAMPRMEGPQSDRDVQLYREAAGQIGDPTVPAAVKKAAVRTIKQIQDRYISRAATVDGQPAPQAPVRRRYNPQTGKIE